MGVVDAPAALPRGACALCGLPDTRQGRRRSGFSLGMKQRLGLALALIGSPDLLLLDEPLNGLDPEGTRAMRNLLVRLNDTLGVTIVISSHVLDQLDRVATRFGVIANGTMVREMTADQVQAECGDTLRVRTADPVPHARAARRGAAARDVPRRARRRLGRGGRRPGGRGPGAACRRSAGAGAERGQARHRGLVELMEAVGQRRSGWARAGERRCASCLTC